MTRFRSRSVRGSRPALSYPAYADLPVDRDLARTWDELAAREPTGCESAACEPRSTWRSLLAWIR